MGRLPPQRYTTLQLVVKHKHATDWDVYSTPGPGLTISARLRDILLPLASPCFEFMPVKLNDQIYYLLRRAHCIDCFDEKNSQVDYFPHNPTKIMRVRVYSFFLSRLSDPILFCIPGLAQYEFCTGGAKEQIELAGVRGIDFIKATE